MNAEVYISSFALLVFFSLIISVVATQKIIRAEYNKKVKIDISIDEMLESEEKIAKFLKTNNLKPDGSIEKIATALKVKNGGSSNTVKGRALLSEPDTDGSMTVTFNRKIPSSERLFDLAHECGHLVNGDPTPANRPTGYNKPKMEQLADYTGAALLMPRQEILKYLVENNYDSASNGKRVRVIRKLSKKYKVNEIIAVRRINEVRILRDTSLQ